MLKKLLPVSLSLLLTISAWTSPSLAADTKDSSSKTNMQFGKGDMADVEVKNLHHSGKLFVKKIKVTESTIVNGALESDSSEFNKQTVVNGQLSAKDSTFHELSVNGGVIFKNVKVNGPADVNGSMKLDGATFNNTLHLNGDLMAKDSSFSKTITVKGRLVDLTNSNAQDIMVQKGAGNVAQLLILNGTKVAGNVTFEGGNGVVKQDDKSSIGGSLTGGTVTK